MDFGNPGKFLFGTVEYLIVGLAVLPILILLIINVYGLGALSIFNRTMTNSYIPYVFIVLLLITYVLGMAWDGACAMFQLMLYKIPFIEGLRMYRRYKNTNWLSAQRMEWSSKAASEEFSYHRLRYRITRDWAFALLFMILECLFLAENLLTFILIILLILFFLAFISASRDYNSLVNDAEQLDEKIKRLIRL